MYDKIESLSVVYNNRFVRCLCFAGHILMVVLHTILIKNLQQPAGIAEAFRFLISEPEKYLAVIFCTVLMCVITFILSIAMIPAFLYKNGSFNLIEYIISVLIVFVMWGFCFCLLNKTMILIICLVLLCLGVYALGYNKYNNN